MRPVTLTATDREGTPAEDCRARVQDHDDEEQWWFDGARHGSEVTIRTPPGKYRLDARFETPDGGMALLVYPFAER